MSTPRPHSWRDLTAAAPDLAAAVQGRFDATGLGLLATLRKDGSPRISGIEPWFGAGDLWMGMMHQSRKALDLLRDPRLALHSASEDKEVTQGDARVSGRAVAVTDPAATAEALEVYSQHAGHDAPPGPMHLFRVDVTEAMFLKPGGDHLVIEWWTPAKGRQRVERA